MNFDIDILKQQLNDSYRRVMLLKISRTSIKADLSALDDEIFFHHERIDVLMLKLRCAEFARFLNTSCWRFKL